MRIAVAAWMIDPVRVAGPTRGVAVRDTDKPMFAMFLHWKPLPGQRMLYHFERGHRYRIGSTILFSEEAAVRVMRRYCKRILEMPLPYPGAHWFMSAKVRRDRAEAFLKLTASQERLEP